MTTTNSSTTKRYCACSGKWCEFANLQGFCTLTACCAVANQEFIKAIDRIKEIPSVPQWIPCSERLPEPRRSVIISTKEWAGEGCYWETTEYHVIWKGYRWNATYWDDEVTAWMPLPEPYKEN